MDKTKVYLGDDVYVEYIGSTILLYTNDKTSESSFIYLNPEVRENLLQFLRGIK